MRRQAGDRTRRTGACGCDLHAQCAGADPATPQPQAIPFSLLYEDADLIVLDKPAGLVVHPAPGNLDGTLVNALLAHCGPGFTGIGAERRPGIVHRLDKDTSGVMVVAKTQLANDALTAAFAARDLDRAYLALVLGPATTRPSGEIEGAIGRDPRDRKRMAVVDPRRQGGPDPLPDDARLADQPRVAGMPAGDRAERIRSACTVRQRAPDCRRSRLPASDSDGRQGHDSADFAANFLTSQGRRCTRPAWLSHTREQVAR